MSDPRTLIFEPSIGIPPAPGTLEHDLFHACCVEDESAWDKLCGVPMEEPEKAVDTLRRLGWNFRLVRLQ